MTRRELRSYLTAMQDLKLDSESAVSLVSFYKTFLCKERAIYVQLNKFSREGTLVYGYLWSTYDKEKFMQQFYGHEDEGIDYSV